MGSIDAAEEWLDSWATGVNTNAARAVELSRRVAALTGKARTGLGTVVVGSSGSLERLDLADQATRRLTGSELSREIMALVRRAQADLASRVAKEVEHTVGADTEMGRAVVHSYASRLGGEPHAR